MNQNKLIVLDHPLPLKAYPKAQLDKVMATAFRYWLSVKLSIKGDKDTELDDAIESIKELFWSMGLHQVKEAFTMYVLGQLSIQPKSNYIDSILVGQIFNAYKSTQRTKNKSISQEDEDYYFIVCAYDSYLHDGNIQIETGSWLYDYFVHHKNWVKFKEDHKQHLWNAYRGYDEREKTVKTELIKDFFNNLNGKGIHIKHFIASKNPQRTNQ